jgi:hypothetical protein
MKPPNSDHPAHSQLLYRLNNSIKVLDNKKAA